MTEKEIDLAAHIFGRQYTGKPPTKEERAFLHGLLDRMETPERAGSIAAIIKILLQEN
jgi:hypothetical protein